MKLVVVCRAFCVDFMILRWRKLAAQYPDLEVTLIGSGEYVLPSGEWGERRVLKMESFQENNFTFKAVAWRRFKWWPWGAYHIPGFIGMLKKLQPDFLYLIGAENADFLFQAIVARRLFFKRCKLAMFTMRGTNMPMRHWNFRLRWILSRRFIDAYFTHAPCCVKVLRTQGKVWQPIYMQTQVGVNTDVFKPDVAARKAVRAQYGIADDVFLFGTACRIDVRKGLLDMMDALPLPGVKWKFMICGSGPDEEKVRQRIRARGIEDQVIWTGRIDGYENMNRYMNAMDCFVLMSQTIPWSNVDTYPLVVSQSMASARPQIVSDSGGLPYEVESDGWVVHERNSEELHKAMIYAVNHPDECRERGSRLKARLEHSFALSNLNPLFYDTMMDVIEGRYDVAHMDQMRTKPVFTYFAET